MTHDSSFYEMLNLTYVTFWPYLAIYGHLAIGPWAINSGKWGIPEKSYKNVAQ